MKPKIPTIVLLSAAQMFTANLVSTESERILTRMLALTDAQKAQVQPYLDAVQPQLDDNHQQALWIRLSTSFNPCYSDFASV